MLVLSRSNSIEDIVATLEDAEQLRNIWDPEHLRQYENCWIAFRNGGVVDSNPNLDDLSKQFEADIQFNKGPLFAFVTFEATV